MITTLRRSSEWLIADNRWTLSGDIVMASWLEQHTQLTTISRLRQSVNSSTQLFATISFFTIIDWHFSNSYQQFTLGRPATDSIYLIVSNEAQYRLAHFPCIKMLIDNHCCFQWFIFQLRMFITSTDIAIMVWKTSNYVSRSVTYVICRPTLRWKFTSLLGLNELKQHTFIFLWLDLLQYSITLFTWKIPTEIF